MSYCAALFHCRWKTGLGYSYICIVLFLLYITAKHVGLDVCICSSHSGELSKEKNSLAYLFDA